MALTLVKQDKRGYNNNKKDEPLINERLRYNSFINLITENGIIKISYQEAQSKADKQDLDLVQVSMKDNLPLCKIFNYEKFIYEQKKNKKNQKKQELKEIKLSPSIAENDLNVKVKAAKKFIENGDKIKVTLTYKGRENTNKDFNKKSLLKFIVMVEDFAVPESLPKDENNKCIVILKAKK